MYSGEHTIGREMVRSIRVFNSIKLRKHLIISSLTINRNSTGHEIGLRCEKLVFLPKSLTALKLLCPEDEQLLPFQSYLKCGGKCIREIAGFL